MADEFKLSPETAALAEMAGRVINATLESGLEGDLKAFEAEIDSAVSEATPSLPDADAARQEAKAGLFKQAMRVHSQAVQAIREAREEDRKKLEATYAALHARIKDIGRYDGFSAAAERLHRSKGFDDFIAGVPHVDLARIYGSGLQGISPLPLIWAIEAKERPVERVQAMLTAGARLDLTTKLQRFTVLHWMAQSKRKGRSTRLAIVRLLLQNGADLEAQDRNGRTPLHVAIELGSAEDVATLLEAGADGRTLSGDKALPFFAGIGRTPLMMAADEPEKMRVLLEHGCDPTQLAADGTDLRQFLRHQLAQADSWLIEVAEKKRPNSTSMKLRDARAEALAMVEPLLGPQRIDPDQKLTFKDAPDLFQKLRTDLPLDEYHAILKRVDINTFSAPNGDRPINWPIRAKSDRVQRLELMLEAGASVEGKPDKATVLHVFATTRRKNAEEQWQILQVLLQAGADLSARDSDSRTPLASAVGDGALVEAAAILRARAEARAPGSPTPNLGRLLYAAEKQPRMFQLLLENGAYPPPGSATRRGLDREMAEEIDTLEARLKRDLSGNLRRETERRLKGLRACQDLLVAWDASAD